MFFLVSIVYIVLFYLSGLYKIISRRLLLFPFLGAAGSWLLTALLLYFTLAFIFWFFHHFSDLFWPQWSNWLYRLTNNTGLKRIDRWLFWLSLFFSFFFLFTNPSLLPLSLILAIGTYLTFLTNS